MNRYIDELLRLTNWLGESTMGLRMKPCLYFFTLLTSLAWYSGVQLWWMIPMPPHSWNNSHNLLVSLTSTMIWLDLWTINVNCQWHTYTLIYKTKSIFCACILDIRPGYSLNTDHEIWQQSLSLVFVCITHRHSYSHLGLCYSVHGGRDEWRLEYNLLGQGRGQVLHITWQTYWIT